MAASPAQAHYLGHVLRRSVGDILRLFNGRDGEWLGEIAALQRERASLIARQSVRLQQAEADIWLLFSLLKRDAMDLVAQKATELGVAALMPVTSQRSNATRTNLERLAAIATEAAEQSERLTVPVVHPVRPLDQVLTGWPPGRPLRVAAERVEAAGLKPATTPAALLVGPEGGFTPAELDGLRRRPFVTLVSLGPRILRSETACLAGLALLQAPGCG